MLPHIKAHSLMVSQFAVHITQALNATGLNFNIPEIEAAALLHDITKTQSIETGEDHAQTGAELLQELGFMHVAQIVREHITPTDRGKALTTEEILSYADKRVLHDRLVSLDERFKYLLKRYGGTEQTLRRIHAAKTRTKAIEDKIVATLNSNAYDILNCIT